MLPLKGYAQRQILRELEWQCRSALAVADDLSTALQEQNGEQITAVTRTLVVRIQKIAELLWPGDRRLPDRLAEGGGEQMRKALGVAAPCVLEREQIEALFELLNTEVAGDQPPARRVGRRWCIVQASDCSYDLAPMLDEVNRVWGASADLLGI